MLNYFFGRYRGPSGFSVSTLTELIRVYISLFVELLLPEWSWRISNNPFSTRLHSLKANGFGLFQAIQQRVFGVITPAIFL